MKLIMMTTTIIIIPIPKKENKKTLKTIKKFQRASNQFCMKDIKPVEKFKQFKVEELFENATTISTRFVSKYITTKIIKF